MKNEKRENHTAALWTAILAIAGIVSALLLPAIPQDPSYHEFADSRTFLGIPNTLDVLSNMPLIVLGFVGIVSCIRKKDLKPVMETVRLKILLFATVLLTGIGSAIYHWRPDNDSLLWDRFPLSVMFLAVYLVVLADRISPKIADRLVWPVLAAGPLSVLHWYWSELQGSGDLRFYGFVQLIPLLLIPATIFLRPNGSIKNIILWKAYIWYGLAKVAEFQDTRIFELTGWISGHTIKHLCAGVAVFYLLAICKKIKPLHV